MTHPFALPDFRPGTVWLVGAGPGDAGLLTLLALRAIEAADVIVHDALIGDDILSAARPDALIEDAGKRGGRPSPKQAEITARLIAHASEGRRVLRLKGGDPFVFGRGGEEALALAEAGVPFRIVPGVTAGIGGLAYAGIPATHRGMASATAFVTGHGAAGTVPEDVDWPALACGAQTIVLYMGLRTLEDIATRLMEGGRSPMTSVAIVSNASTPRQTVITTNLVRCARESRRLNAKSPAIIVVGEVARLHDLLAPWQQIGPNGETVADLTAAPATAAVQA